MSEHLMNELDSKVDVTVELAAMSLSDPLWNYNELGVMASCDALFRDKEVGLVVVTTNLQEMYRKHNDDPIYLTGDLIIVERKIVRDQANLGTVTIGFTKYYLENRLRQEIITDLVVVLVTLLILWVLISFVVLLVTKPIYALVRGTEEIAKGNLEKRLPIECEDEIGQLACKFNIMAEKLQFMMRELALSEEKFYKAFHHVTDVISIVNVKNRHYIEINKAFSKFLGYGREEIIGHTSQKFGLWNHNEDYIKMYQAIDKDGIFYDIEVSLRTKSGEIKIGLVSGEIVQIDKDDCLIAIWHDITERKQAEAILLQAHNELEQRVESRTQELFASNQELMAMNEEMLAMNESLQETLDQLQKAQFQLIQSEKMAALGGLVAGVAHEINTPLGNSITMASYLRSIFNEFSALSNKGQVHKKELEDFISDGEEGLRSLEMNLARAAKLVRSFKNVATNQMVEERQVFDVRLYLEEIILTLRSRLKKTRLELVIYCPENLKWDSYPDVFMQIMTNLIINSLIHAYSPIEEGVLTFSFREEKKELVIEYADDGNGMEEKVCKKVFEPFFTTARSSGGTGLGLYIVYNLVTQKLRGDIQCSSQLGMGTRFTIRVPIDSCSISS